jgi:hypothetical protein
MASDLQGKANQLVDDTLREEKWVSEYKIFAALRLSYPDLPADDLQAAVCAALARYPNRGLTVEDMRIFVKSWTRYNVERRRTDT